MTQQPQPNEQLELAGIGSLRTAEGSVLHVRFYNEETGYAVLRVALATDTEETWVGVAPPLQAGMHVRGRGRIEDSKFGEQFRCETLLPILPTSADGIERYLGSGAITGVGPALARRIVELFGEGTFEVLSTQPNQLLRVNGIGPEKLRGIVEAWATEQSTAELMAFLEQHGASPGLAGAIVKRYKSQAIHVVSTQPYRLAIEIVRIGFKTADTIARSVGIAVDSPDRARAATLHVLQELTSKGHCYATLEALADATAELLGPGAADAYEAVESLALPVPPPAGAPPDERPSPPRLLIERVDDETRAVYPRRLYDAEVELAARVIDLLEASGPPLGGYEEAIAKFEQTSGMTLAPEQRAAVEAAATHNIIVLTGGPGTGKSCVTKAILHVFDKAGLTVLLASPTGRAAKRLSEATGWPASTIHRTLGMREGGRGFAHTREYPLTTGALITDELSMGDVELMNALFQALRTSTRVVLVGDVDQLPSVGPGAVLRDMIDSGAIPTIRLTRIFRQAEGSQIIEAAARINRGETPMGARPGSGGEFFVMHEKDSAAAAEKAVRLVTTAIPTHFGFDPVRDVQVITPMIKGSAGVLELNNKLQGALNPTGAALTRGKVTFRVGDKVIQTKNDYDREVYNGDIGIVVEVDPDGAKLVVEMDDNRQVVYVKADLDHLLLAYAITCHRFQGSQAKAIVVLLMREHFMLLSRNWLYTAVTRGEKVVTLVCDPSALSTALKETRREVRRTRLAWRLRTAAQAIGRQPADPPPAPAPDPEPDPVLDDDLPF